MEKRSNTKTGKSKTSGKSKVLTRAKHQFDGTYKGDPGQDVNTEKSRTVPDMALSPKILLNNHVRGIPQPVHYYDGIYSETEVPRPDMDMVEKKEFLEDLQNRKHEAAKKVVEEVKEARKKAEAKKKKEKDEEIIESAHKKPPTDGIEEAPEK